MSEYVPDTWVVLELKSEHTEPIRKVFAGWYGGYTGSDEWRLNSGITETIDHGKYYEFRGHSGSVYLCNKKAQGMSHYQASVLEGFKRNLGASIEVIELA